MKKLIPALLVATLSFGASALTSTAATVPCETMLKDMRAAKIMKTLSDADTAKVQDLEDKAVERCNADDDVRADRFLTEAMTIIGK